MDRRCTWSVSLELPSLIDDVVPKVWYVYAMSAIFCFGMDYSKGLYYSSGCLLKASCIILKVWYIFQYLGSGQCNGLLYSMQQLLNSTPYKSHKQIKKIFWNLGLNLLADPSKVIHWLINSVSHPLWKYLYGAATPLWLKMVLSFMK